MIIKKRLLCLILCFSLLTCFSAFRTISTAVDLSDDEQSKIDALKDEAANLDSEIDEANKKLSELKENVDKQAEYAAELNSQIEVLQKKIDNLSAMIDILSGKIDEKNEEIAGKEAEIDALEQNIDENEQKIGDLQDDMDLLYSQLKQRLREIYMSGGRTSDIEILLCSGSYETFLMKMELSSNMAEHDDAIVNEITESISEINALTAQLEELILQVNAEKKELEQAREELDAQKSEVETQQNELEDVKSEVDGKLADVNAVMSQLNADSAEYKALVASYESRQNSIDAEIDAIIDAAAKRAAEEAAKAAAASAGLDASSYSSGGATSFSGGFICPLQYGDVYVSSPFGYRSSGYHGGLDLCCRSGTYGKNVSAAAAGTVIVASYHYSYGNYVVIQHSSSFMTLYAHNSALLVSAGQTVSQGQTIALAGSTGNSTGPHCHFEVRVNGSRVNPSSYIYV